MDGSVGMELDDLLQQEGLGAEGAEQTLAWARGRAEELVRDVGNDPELGPLLDGVDVPSAPPATLPPMTPEPVVGEETAPVSVESASADDGGAEPVAAEASAAEAPAEDPLADMDFDGLPGISGDTDIPIDAPAGESEATPQAVLPGGTEPVDVPQPIVRAGTEPADLPPVPSSDESVSAASEDPAQAQAPVAADDEEEIVELDDFELLDDDDLELVEEEGEDPPSPPPGDGESLPEWQAALTSAQLGGDAKADQDSGLLRMGGPPAPTPPDAPQDGDAPNAEAADESAGEGDEEPA